MSVDVEDKTGIEFDKFISGLYGTVYVYLKTCFEMIFNGDKFLTNIRQEKKVYTEPALFLSANLVLSLLVTNSGRSMGKPFGEGFVGSVITGKIFEISSYILGYIVFIFILRTVLKRTSSYRQIVVALAYASVVFVPYVFMIWMLGKFTNWDQFASALADALHQNANAEGATDYGPVLAGLVVPVSCYGGASIVFVYIWSKVVSAILSQWDEHVSVNKVVLAFTLFYVVNLLIYIFVGLIMPWHQLRAVEREYTRVSMEYSKVNPNYVKLGDQFAVLYTETNGVPGFPSEERLSIAMGEVFSQLMLTYPEKMNIYSNQLDQALRPDDESKIKSYYLLEKEIKRIQGSGDLRDVGFFQFSESSRKNVDESSKTFAFKIATESMWSGPKPIGKQTRSVRKLINISAPLVIYLKIVPSAIWDGAKMEMY